MLFFQFLENFIIYKPYILSDDINRDKNDNNKKDIKEKDKNNSSKKKKIISYYFYKFIFIFFILLVIIIIILFWYKEIRRYQINNIINSLSINNNEKSNCNYELVNEGNISNINQEKNYNSKISYMI